jgi:NTP pyrophosphatase (non-canonical NTP hydrolase)
MQKSDKPPKVYYHTPLREYFKLLNEIDKGKRYSEEFGSILILGIVEEVGEIARAYLAKHGRKRTNKAAETDESMEQELGDLLLSILRFARIQKINLHDRLMYSINKVKERRLNPKVK